MINTGLRENTTRFIATNQGSLAFSILLLVAFCLVSVNAMFIQPEAHPVPIWNSKVKSGSRTNAQTQKYSVPVRKVETVQIPVQKIPVPQLRSSAKLLLSNSVGSITKPEDVDVDMVKVQRLLVRLGIYNGSVDGLIGPQTVTAIKKFEHIKGLPENGKASPSLLLLLETALDRASLDILNDLKRRKKSSGSQVTIAAGQNEAEIITRIQVGLINFGNDKVSIDGVMGSQTRVAIEEFQKRFKLEINGAPSMALIRKLESVGALTRG